MCVFLGRCREPVGTAYRTAGACFSFLELLCGKHKPGTGMDTQASVKKHQFRGRQQHCRSANVWIPSLEALSACKPEKGLHVCVACVHAQELQWNPVISMFTFMRGRWYLQISQEGSHSEDWGPLASSEAWALHVTAAIWARPPQCPRNSWLQCLPLVLVLAHAEIGASHAVLRMPQEWMCCGCHRHGMASSLDNPAADPRPCSIWVYGFGSI